MANVSYNLLDDYKKISKDFVLTIGNFDGLHTGHRLIIEKTLEDAKKLNATACVISFYNKPAPLFDSSYVNTQILPLNEKINALCEYGFENIFLFNYNSPLKDLTAIEFLDFLKINTHIKSITVGENFLFGKGRGGDVELIKNFFSKEKIKVNVIPLLFDNGVLISSTMIRQRILSGDFSVNKYLKNPFYIQGCVEEGKHLGRVLAFPTANIYIYDQIKPKAGVYATISLFEKDNLKFSMTHVAEEGNIETHIFDTQVDLYNRELRVYFICFMRNNIKVSSIDELSHLLSTDESDIKTFFNDYYRSMDGATKYFQNIIHKSDLFFEEKKTFGSFHGRTEC